MKRSLDPPCLPPCSRFSYLYQHLHPQPHQLHQPKLVSSPSPSPSPLLSPSLYDFSQQEEEQQQRRIYRETKNTQSNDDNKTISIKTSSNVRSRTTKRRKSACLRVVFAGTTATVALLCIIITSIIILPISHASSATSASSGWEEHEPQDLEYQQQHHDNKDKYQEEDLNQDLNPDHLTKDSIVLITGAAGFIGSELAITLHRTYNVKRIICIDSLSSMIPSAAAAPSSESRHDQQYLLPLTEEEWQTFTINAASDKRLKDRTEEALALFELKRQRVFRMMRTLGAAGRFYRADLRASVPERFDSSEVLPVIDSIFHSEPGITHVVHLAGIIIPLFLIIFLLNMFVFILF